MTEGQERRMSEGERDGWVNAGDAPVNKGLAEGIKEQGTEQESEVIHRSFTW